LKRIVIRHLLNLTGGLLTLGSLDIPWFIIGGNAVSMFQPNGFVWFVPWMILAGGLTSMVSRYGGLLTVTGLIAYGVSPPIFFLSTVGAGTTSAFGIGFRLAWAGSGLSIAGTSWSLPFPPSAPLFRKQGEREPALKVAFVASL